MHDPPAPELHHPLPHVPETELIQTPNHISAAGSQSVSTSASLADVDERIGVMKMFRDKRADAMKELWDLVNTDPQLKEQVYSEGNIPSRMYNKACRTWLTSTVRPLLKCLKNHFNDDFETFKSANPSE